MNTIWRQHYGCRRVAVTGGLGFIGSNLALALAGAGAEVRVIDSGIEGCGANDFNLAGASGIAVFRASIGDAEAVREILKGVEVVFNLAGEISHSGSMKVPERDLALNAAAQLSFLESCSAVLPPSIRIVYASTRQLYGIPKSLPVDESHPVEPVDYNGVHKFAAEHYHCLLSRLGRLDAVSLRLTNVFGPRQALHLSAQGVLGVFMRNALEGRRLQVFGDGFQLRDPIHVEDAVRAFLLAGIREVRHRVINIGSGKPVSLFEIAKTVSELAGIEPPQRTPFPVENKRIDIGDYYACIDRARESLGWVPCIPLREGLRATLLFYSERRSEYRLAAAVGGLTTACLR